MWIRWDESIYSDARVRELGLAAFGDRDLGEAYWAKFLTYVKRRGSGGVADVVDGQSLIDSGVGGAAKRWAAFIPRLETSGLVTVDDGRWTVVDWSEYQIDPTANARKDRFKERARTVVTVPERSRTETTVPVRSRTPDVTETKTSTEGKARAPPRWPTMGVEEIYQAYPRHVGKRAALAAIRKALTEISGDGDFQDDDPIAWLLTQVRSYAASPAGRQGQFTPHPTTWMAGGRYNDDQAEWQRVGGLLDLADAQRRQRQKNEHEEPSEEFPRL